MHHDVFRQKRQLFTEPPEQPHPEPQTAEMPPSFLRFEESQIVNDGGHKRRGRQHAHRSARSEKTFHHTETRFLSHN